MRVAVFGAGYVGLVTGACLADLGHDVVVRDIVAEKIDALRDGDVPIHEEGLTELIEKNRERLTFTTEVADGARGSGGRLRRRRHAADPLRRRRPDRGLDGRRRAAARRAKSRPGHEEHRAGRNRSDRPSPTGRARARERRLRVESGVHGRRHRRSRLHASGPDRDRLVRFRRRRHSWHELHEGIDAPVVRSRRRVRRDDQARGERGARHADLASSTRSRTSARRPAPTSSPLPRASGSITGSAPRSCARASASAARASRRTRSR